MQTLFQSLDAWGVNLTEVRARFLDDTELYVNCLSAFTQDPAFPALTQAMEAQDYGAAFEHAHTLKGVSANLGLMPLYRSLCTLVEHLRSGDNARARDAYRGVQSDRDDFFRLIAAAGN